MNHQFLRASFFPILVATGLMTIFNNCSNQGFEAANVTENASAASLQVAPTISLNQEVPEITNQNSLSTSFAVDGTGVVLECSLETPSGAIVSQNCADQSLQITNLSADGDYSLSIMATSSSGLKTRLRRVFRRDSTPPEIKITAQQATVTSSKTAQFNFSVTDNLSGVQATNCQLDMQSQTVCSQSVTYSALAAGSHNFIVKASDVAGNQSSATVAWVIDSTSPIVTIGAKPLSLEKSTSAQFSFSSTKSGQFECKLDSSAFTSCGSPGVTSAQYSASSLTPNSSHQFQVRQVDELGNVSGVVSYSWVIDTQAPALPQITSNLSSPSKVGSAQLSFNSSDVNGIKAFECSSDGNSYSTCSSPKSVSFAEGNQKYFVRAIDLAGNISASAQYSILVDLTPPLIQLQSVPSNGTSQNYSISFSVSEAGSGVDRILCSLNSAAFSACTSPVSGTVAVGTHSFRIQSFDKAGNNSSISSVSWNVTAVAPPPVVVDPPVTPPVASVNIIDFGAKADGSTDNWQAITNAIASAKSRSLPVLVPAGVFAFGKVLKLDGVKLGGVGDSSVLYAKDPLNSAIFLYGSGAGVNNIKLSGAKTTVRQAPWETCKIVPYGSTNWVIDNVTIDFAAGAGIHVTQGASFGTIKNTRVSDTLADSIHMTARSNNIILENNVIQNSGDDGIAVVSYFKDEGYVTDIKATNNRILNNKWGRNMSVVGGKRVHYENNIMDGNEIGAACLYIAQEDAWETYGAYDVMVKYNTLKNCGSTNMGHGAALIFSDGKDQNSNVQLFRNDISQTPIGIRIYGALNSGIVVDSNKMTSVAKPYSIESASGVSKIDYVSGASGPQ